MKKIIITTAAVLALGGLAACGAAETAAVSDQEAPIIVEESTPMVTEEPTVIETPDSYALSDTLENIDGTWNITIKEVVLNANAAIASAYKRNDPPQHQYLMITIEGTNIGADFEELMFLDTQVLGNDNALYDLQWQVTPYDQDEVQTEAAPGGIVQDQFLFDVPANVVSGGFLLIGDDRVRVAL